MMTIKAVTGVRGGMQLLGRHQGPVDRKRRVLQRNLHRLPEH